MEVLLAQPAVLAPAIERLHDALTEAFGTERVASAFFAGVREIGEVDRIYCFAARADRSAPSLFCAWAAGPEIPALIARYKTVYHHHDPIRAVLPRIPARACASITFEANEIAHREYREVCFERYSIRHRLSVVKCVGDAWLAVNLVRRARPFTAAEIAALSALGRLALPLVARSHAFLARSPGGNLSVSEMERRLAAIGSGRSRLTPRERQVCARTIAGIGAEGIACDLGIAIASVLTYRQRAYRRVRVSNALQLAALVMH